MAKLLKTGNLIARRIVGYEVVTELPELIEIGELKLYNGTMWRGLLDGESSLAAGTPWPVKGYKELNQSILTQDDTGFTLGSEIINDFGLPFDFVRVSIGDFSSQNYDFANNPLLTLEGYVPTGYARPIYYSGEENVIITSELGVAPYDIVYEWGGLIIIKQYPPPPTP